METYSIVRFYHPSQNKENEIILQGVSLEQAREHCTDDSTKEEGVYFDGYVKE